MVAEENLIALKITTKHRNYLQNTYINMPTQKDESQIQLYDLVDYLSASYLFDHVTYQENEDQNHSISLSKGNWRYNFAIQPSHTLELLRNQVNTKFKEDTGKNLNLR